jgi:PAS domain S-box-containing protein
MPKTDHLFEDKTAYLQKIIDAFQHPFYVVDVDTYVIRYANKACGFGELDGQMTCHMRTHHSPVPCTGKHVCPLDELKRTKRAVKTEHIHYDADGNPRTVEVHGDPVFDDDGRLIYMVEYSFDITELTKAQEELKYKLDVVEDMNKRMLVREERVLELKKEINNLLKGLGKPPKYYSN